MNEYTKAESFSDLACLCYSRDEDVRRRERAIQLLEDDPGLTSNDVYAASAACDVEAVRRLIDRDPGCVNRPGGPRDWPPLMYLAYSRAYEVPPARDAVAVARLLLDSGADPRFYIAGASNLGGWRWTALTGVIGEGEGGVVQEPPHPRARELAEMLLEAGADPNEGQGLYNSMFTPGNEWLELLLSHGLTKEAIADRDGDSPVTTLNYQLSFAVKSGFVERVSLLLQHGADARGKDNWYQEGSHLEQAIQNGFGAIVDLLVAHGAPEPDLSTSDRYRIAVMSGNETEARHLLAGEPELRNQANLLVNAAHQGRVDPVRLLLELGTDPNELAESGRGALHEAAWAGHEEVVRLLLAKGANCEVRDSHHDGTAVGWANHAGRFDMRDLLLDRSRDVFDLVRFGKITRLKAILDAEPALATISRPNGQTLLHTVTANEAGALIDLLLAHGADIDAKTDDGATPLSSSLDRKDDVVVALLKERGAKRSDSQAN